MNKKLLIAVSVFSAIIPFICFAGTMSELNIQTFEKEKIISEGGIGSSPFAPAKPSPQELLVEDLFLTGVAIGGGRNYALISGYILQEGDAIAGLRVKQIMHKKVVLQHLDRIHTLYLEGGM